MIPLGKDKDPLVLAVVEVELRWGGEAGDGHAPSTSDQDVCATDDLEGRSYSRNCCMEERWSHGPASKTSSASDATGAAAFIYSEFSAGGVVALSPTTSTAGLVTRAGERCQPCGDVTVGLGGTELTILEDAID